MSTLRVILATAIAVCGCSAPSASSPPSSTSERLSTPPMTTTASSAPATASAPSVSSAPSAPSSAPAGPRGTLTVTEKRAGKRTYTEGSIPFAKVAEGTTVVAEEKLEAGTVTFSLAPGSYVLTTYQRPCDGHCGNLDPPADVCSAPVEITAGGVVHATSTVRYGEGCSIEIR